MAEKDLAIVNSVSDILDLKNEHPEKIGEELLRILLLSKKAKFKNSENKLLYISSADKALKIKAKNPHLSKKEIIQMVLNDAK